MRLMRTEYLNKLISFRDKHLVKVVTGVRRCGKSTLLEIYRDHLAASGVSSEQIISVNLEDFDLRDLHDPAALHSYVKQRLIPGKMNYVFIDEVQHCGQFPAVIDSLYLRSDTDIYLTGSNAYMLSGEIATLLSGRYVEIRMLPLSFREYAQAMGGEAALSRTYLSYVQNGSFPYALELLSDKSALRDYLEGVYNTIVIKDIAARKRIQDVMMLESITRFVFDSIGSPLSTKKITDTMTSMSRKIDVKTVERYLEGLTESFVMYRCPRWNIRGKQLLKTQEKYYAVDMGLRGVLLGSRGTDVGHSLENIVYLELLRRGYEVYTGKLDNTEVDFVTMGVQGQSYIQVAASVRDEATLSRELAPLQRIGDQYAKLILTLDEDPEADYNGIRRINALEWLMGYVK